MEHQALVIIMVCSVGAGLGTYIAWCKPTLLQTYLDWNSRIFGWPSAQAQSWMSSRYFLAYAGGHYSPVCSVFGWINFDNMGCVLLLKFLHILPQ
jgi:hypothetical protein